MTIAIIGRGLMGKGLGGLLEGVGENVVVLGRGAAVPEDASVVILAVPHGEAEKALTAAGQLDGKILIDMTNPVGPGFTLSVGRTTSAAEEMQKRFPKVRVVKAFNTVFAELLGLDYAEHGNPPQVLIAGDDAAAKAEATRIAEVIGFEAFDCGPLHMARYLEPMGGLIVELGYAQGRGTRFAPRMDEY